MSARTSLTIPRLATLLCSLAMLLPLTAEAGPKLDLKPKTPGAVTLGIAGDYRLNFSLLDDFAVDAESPITTHGQETYLDQRLRLRLDFQVLRATFSTEWDLLSGQLAGDLWTLGDLDRRNRGQYGAVTLDGFTPRRASLLLRWKDLDVELGLMTSNWGLGMLANDGNQDPMFGRNDLGDRVIRARVTARPGHWRGKEGAAANRVNVTGGFDFVLDDDLATFADGQLAFQVLGSLLVLDENARRGVYFVYRNQQEPEDLGRTSVFVVDGYIDRSFELPKGVKMRLAMEGAGIFGQTSRALTYQEREDLDVSSGAVVGLASLSFFEDKLQSHGKVALASGDANPDDNKSTQFTFDRNFSLGSVLFDQLLGSVALGSHRLVTDPEISGQPPRGVDAIVNEGAAGGILALQKVVEGNPLPWLNLKAGVLLALATADHRQPFYSTRGGGTPFNHHNKPVTSPVLGRELNWAVELGAPIALPKKDCKDAKCKLVGEPALHPTFLIQGGHLFVGEALRAAADEQELIHHVQMTGRLRW